ncbi:hypothetical protein ACKWTF_013490 [Chironomus riparius]
MKLKVASLIVCLLAIFAGFWKFEALKEFISSEKLSLNYLKELLKLSDTCDSETLIIWTAASTKSYDTSIYNIIKNVSTQLNHSVIADSNENGTWHLIWSYEYIFDRFPNSIRFMKLKPYQMVNHFPGFTFLTNKLHMSVSTTQRFIPSAFNFPSLKNEFLYYAKLFPTNHFVVKNMDRGGIEIVPFEKINFGMGSWSYMQLFIESLLIERHAFDIGIYVLITSVEPLRIYKWNQDVLIRFCPEEFEPFNIEAKGKYVCSINYKNIWEFEAFEKLVESGQHTNKEILNNYLQSKGHNSSQLWTNIDFAINTVVADKAKIGLKFMKIYTNRSNNTLEHMFELLRFDFVVDKELNVHLMEINMSPDMNFENDKDERLKTMSLQVVKDTLNMVGAGSYHEFKGNFSTPLSPQNIATSIDACSECDENCESPSCELCVPCMSEDFKVSLYRSYKEHQRRGEFKLIFPKGNNDNIESDVKNDLTYTTKKLMKWYEAKCDKDEDWC